MSEEEAGINRLWERCIVAFPFPPTGPFGLPSAMSLGRMELRVEDSGQALVSLDGSPLLHQIALRETIVLLKSISIYPRY